ncbi:hypothetical protein ACRAWC_22235 [Leifsonia sp. L25]|uniref:hypothetical protein n=1 Tax=Leifsonia sp. L25 TaxID=3423957 RepID=UPI003D681250
MVSRCLRPSPRSWRRSRSAAHDVAPGRPADRRTARPRRPDARAHRAGGARRGSHAGVGRALRARLPRFDSSAMDGWAVAGDGPWRVGEPVLAESAPPTLPLAPGEARPVATGAPVPPGTLTVVRSEDAIPEVDGDAVLIDALATPDPGCDIRRAGEEAAPATCSWRPGPC